MNAQLLGSAASVVLTVLENAGAIVSEVQQVQAFVVSAVQLAEGSGKAGEDKLTAVLNATEVFVADALPHLKADWNALAVQVKSFVNGLVALFNELGVFVKDVGSAIGDAEKAIKAGV